MEGFLPVLDFVYGVEEQAGEKSDYEDRSSYHSYGDDDDNAVDDGCYYGVDGKEEDDDIQSRSEEYFIAKVIKGWKEELWENLQN